MAEKRGRKRTTKQYFGPDEEAAVVRYLSLGKLIQHPDYPDDKNRRLWVGTREEEIEKEMLYNKWLRQPLDTMIESIIRKYKLYRDGVSFQNLHSDTLSFLIIKSDKFKPEKGKKAYSYYGTICKHYLLSLLINDDKVIKKLYSYEDFSTTIEEKEEYSYSIDDGMFDFKAFIQTIIESVQRELDSDNTVGKKRLTENEKKVGLALIDILGSWEITLDEMNGGTKYNKNTVLESMRNYTGLNTKDIRLGMKRYKELYTMLKLDGLENGAYDNDLD